MARVSLLKASHFAWLIVAGAAYVLWPPGTMHVIWSYDYRGGHGYGGFTGRHYMRCTYFSTEGTLTEYPANGQCGWVRFAKPSGRFQ